MPLFNQQLSKYLHKNQLFSEKVKKKASESSFIRVHLFLIGIFWRMKKANR